MKNKRLFLFVVFLWFFLVFGQREVTAAGLTLLDGRLHIGGFYELLASVHTSDQYRHANGVTIPEAVRLWDDAGDVSMFRNTWQAEIEFKLSDHVTAFSIIRFFYDSSFDITGNINKMPSNELRKPQHGDDILRELYLDFAFEDWYIRIGKQQVIWGEAIGNRMADIINPLDNTWHDSVENWEDVRVPVRAIDIHYTGIAWHELDMEFLWIPEDFQPIVLPPEGAQWAIPGLTQPILDGIYGDQPTKHSIANSEIGFRAQARFNRLEFALFYFYTRADGSVFHLDQFFQAHQRWPFYNVFGGSFNFYEERTETVFTGEWAYFRDLPFSPINPVVFNFTTFQLEFPKIFFKDQFSFMLGFDRPFWIKALNKDRVFTVGGQFFHSRVLHHEDNMSVPVQSEDSYQNMVSLNIMTSYFHEYIQPSFFIIYDFSGTWWAKPEIKYVPSDYLNIALGANIFSATTLRDSVWGPFRKSDEIYVRVRVPF